MITNKVAAAERKLIKRLSRFSWFFRVETVPVERRDGPPTVRFEVFADLRKLRRLIPTELDGFKVVARPCRRCAAARNKLVEDNKGLAYEMCNRMRRRFPMLPRWFPDRSEEDWQQLFLTHMLRVAELYDDNYLVNGKPVKFSTYVCVALERYVYTQISKYITKAKSRNLVIPFTDIIDTTGDRHGLAGAIEKTLAEVMSGLDKEYRGDELEIILDLASKVVSPRNWEMIQMRLAGYKLSEIAQRLAVSKERVRQCIEQGLERIRRSYQQRTSRVGLVMGKE